MLCCVGFVFSSPRRLDVRDERDVHVHDVLWPDLEDELPDRFEKRQPFDVAGRAANFRDHNVGFAFGSEISRMRFLISSVTCGITCTVLPR